MTRSTAATTTIRRLRIRITGARVTTRIGPVTDIATTTTTTTTAAAIQAGRFTCRATPEAAVAAEPRSPGRPTRAAAMGWPSEVAGTHACGRAPSPVIAA